MKLNEVSSSIGATGGPLHKIQSNLSDAIQDLKSAIHTNPELKHLQKHIKVLETIKNDIYDAR